MKFKLVSIRTTQLTSLLILNFHVVDTRDLFISRPFALLKFEVSHPNIRKCVGKSWALMKQKANMFSIETGSLDNPDPGIRGRDYADVLTIMMHLLVPDRFRRPELGRCVPAGRKA